MPAIAAAAIGVGGSLLGGITGGKGAKKAAKIQAASVDKQIAATQANQKYIAGLEQPTIDRGNAAGSTYANFLGLNGGTAAADGLATFRGSTGYQDLLNTGLGSVNANAYAKGLGDSGATMKALQAKGMSIADSSAQGYLGNLQNLIGYGNSAISNVAGVASNATTANNAALQTGADASSNAALTASAAWQKAISGLATTGQNYASSFGSQYPSSKGWWG